MRIDLLRRLEECLWPKGYTRDVWMIVDSARDERIFGLLLECFYSTHACLFAGMLAPEVKMTAPYLIPLEHDDKKTRKFLSHGWGNHWGVLLKCNERQDSLRRHLRKLLTVRVPEGQRMLFRFYDPRVLRTYLRTCNSEDRERFFGPIQQFWMEGERGEDLLTFSNDENAGPKRAEQPSTVLTIRKEQLRAFSASAYDRFIDTMMDHTRKYFPSRHTQLGEAALRQTVAAAIEKARAYGIRSKRDVCKVINVAVTLGPDFDQKFSLLRDILATPAPGELKARRLSAAFLAVLRKSKELQ